MVVCGFFLSVKFATSSLRSPGDKNLYFPFPGFHLLPLQQSFVPGEREVDSSPREVDVRPGSWQHSTQRRQYVCPRCVAPSCRQNLHSSFGDYCSLRSLLRSGSCSRYGATLDSSRLCRNDGHCRRHQSKSSSSLVVQVENYTLFL